MKDVTGKEIGGGPVNVLQAILEIPLEIENIEDKTVKIGEEVAFTVTATDADDDNEDLVLSALLDNGDTIETVGASFDDNGDGTGDFSFTPTDDHSGQLFSILFKAKDSNGLVDEEMVSITVKEPIPDTPTIIMPVPNTAITESTVTFQWVSVDGVTAYYLQLGTKGEGSKNVYRKYLGNKTSATVSHIPLNGQTIFVRLHFKKDGAWDSNDFTYTTINKNSTTTDLH